MDTDSMEEGPQRMEPPAHGFKVPLDYSFPINTKQTIDPNTKQALALLPLSMRYLSYYIDSKIHNKRPIMDYITQISAQRMYGCPIGGIGGGTIGRGLRGEFCRFHLYPGRIDYVTVPECQFIVNIRDADDNTIFQSVMSTYDKPKKAPASWEWNLKGSDCHYTALYPRAWTTYDLSAYGVKLICKQISPVIPHNYKDSSLPCAVFVWSATNVSDEKRTVSITFTWKEIQTGKKKRSATPDLERYSEAQTSGVSLEQRVAGAPCTFTLAKRRDGRESIHRAYCTFGARAHAAHVWRCLRERGRLEPRADEANVRPARDPRTQMKEHRSRPKAKKPDKWDAMGLSSSVSLEPGGTDIMEFCLSWDMPVIQFRKSEKLHKRFYTRYFGSDGLAGAGIAAYALANYRRWERELDAWQEPILNDSNIPEWLKSALMNELYYIADGGALWFDVRDEFPDTDPRFLYGVYGYLEGQEYRMYNTYDVHFYASFALAQLWPNLQVVLQYMFRDTITKESSNFVKALYDGKSSRRKVKDSVPHDLGDPDEAPFALINAYNIHDVSEWRDLNCKFVLQVFRDYRLLRGANSALCQARRYRSLAYIDDVPPGTEDDLYVHSTRSEARVDSERAARTRLNSNLSVPDCDASRTVPNGEARTRLDSSPSVPNDASGTVPNGQARTHLDSSPSIPDDAAAAVPNGPRTGTVDARTILEMLCSEREERTYSRRASRSEGEPERERSGAWSAERYAADMYPACAALVRRMRAWDADGDGLIENSGAPDQTFDAWVMTGPSSYCGGLWLTALLFMKTLAQQLDKREDEAEFDAMLKKATDSYESKLWNGTFYKFDTLSSNERVVMSAQLCGHWYLRAAGFDHVVLQKERVLSSLRTIYENNVLKFYDGKLGAVNGFVIEKNGNGHIDRTALQSEEMWTGVTYALAALMVHEGMTEQAWKTAGGMYRTMSEGMGLSFETPEALTVNGNHRSIGYMRPLSVWAIYHALNMKSEAVHAVGNGDLTKEL